MSRNDSLDLISKALFDDSVQLSEADQLMLLRLKDAYTFWLDKPLLSDSDIRDYLMVKYDLSKPQALNDLYRVKILLGNVTNASKEFMRHKVNTLMDEAYAAANAGFDKKAKALAKIAEIIIANNRTDQDDGEKLPFDQIVPKDYSYTLDPSIVGVKPDPSIKKKAESLYQKYAEDIEVEIEDNDGREDT